MAVTTSTLRVDAKGDGQAIDLTEAISQEVVRCAIHSGTVTVFVKHTTAAVATIEVEPGLLEDYKVFWDRVVPLNAGYRHNRSPGEDNGHAHVRASTLGPSLVVPVVDGCLTLGTWQRIVLFDFDTRARTREIVLQVIGEERP